MRLPPAVFVEEAPNYELAGRETEFFKMATSDVDRGSLRRGCLHVINPETVVPDHPDRDKEAKIYQRANCQYVNVAPKQHKGPLMAEIEAVGELVPKGQQNCYIRK